MTEEELQEKYALVKKYKSELKNEEMALVLLKKLKQSQTITRESTIVGGGATLTPTTMGSKSSALKADQKSQYSSKNSNSDLLASDKLVSCFKQCLEYNVTRLNSIVSTPIKHIFVLLLHFGRKPKNLCFGLRIFL